MSEIKDSGERTQFASGAVRDMHKGKGRFDLMPLSIIEQYCKLVNSTASPIVGYVREFYETKNTACLLAAMAEFQVLNGWTEARMMLELAKHFEKGAEKYGEHNWEQGIPLNSYIDSALRHFFKWLDGWDDEPHDVAFVWNLMCCAWAAQQDEKIY